MSLRIIRGLWIAGNAGLLASVVLPQPVGLIVMGVADAVLAIAWLWAIGRTLVAGKAKWALAIAVFPLVMWGYIFGLVDEEEDAQETPVSSPAAPRPVDVRHLNWVTQQRTQPLAQPVTEPLAIRQARETIAEAERRYPDW